MTFSVMWTVLPNGYAGTGTGTLRLSLIASPRITDTRAALGNSPLLAWPTFAANLPPLFVQTKGGSGLVPATRTGPVPDLPLWREMFDATTQVRTRGVSDTPPQIVAADASFVLAHRSLQELRRTVARERRIDTTGRVSGQGASRAERIIRAIHPATDNRARVAGRPESLVDEVSRLRAAGDEDAALAAPLAAYARMLGRATGGAGATPGPRSGRPLAGVPPITAADFHQVIGLLLTHPHLAIAVGLRIDLSIPAFSGPRIIRVVGPNGQPVNGDAPVPQPFSRVVADPGRRRFVMQDGPGPTPEIKSGMLAVAGNPNYVVSTIDVVGQSLQLAAQSTTLASARAGEAVDPDPPAGRDLGITIARLQRPSVVVGPRVQRAGGLHHELISAPPAAGGPELAADDVSRGFRLDVSRNGRPFRSLMTRRVATTVGGKVLPPVEDEGVVEAFTGVEQTDGEGVTRLTTGEEVASWDGWSIAVPRPGFKVETEPGAPAQVVPAPPVTIPGYRVRTEIGVVPGSVERLRFGDTLIFRARSVDLGGNSIEPTAIDPSQVLPATRFLRTQGAASPTVVLRRRYSAGESLHHLVVRSQEGVPEGTPCERHLAAPNVSQALAERHGVFDAALGNNRGNQGIRDETFAVARREAGSFLDPVVPGPTGAPVPARGIAVVSNNPVAPPVALPIPRGRALPNGAYVIHDTDHPQLPYLADPIAEGVSLIGFPGTQGPVVVPYAGARWPDVQPLRLVVRPTTRLRPPTTAEVVDDGGRPALVLHVPPGFTGTVELSSSIRAALLDQLETLGASPKVITAGLLPELSPRQQITIVHAVRRPSAAPAVTGPVTPIVAEDAPRYTATVPVSVHRPTTAQVDVEATWQEIDDPGVGALVDAARTLRVGTAIIDRTGPATVAVQVSQLFGDTRHRRITLTPWAGTRFREYYPPVPPGDRSLQRPATQGRVLSIKNRAKPAVPVVHSVIPLFEWSRFVDGDGRLASTRATAGLRVYLHRRWQTTGEGELLGVVLHPESGSTPEEFGRLETMVSRWGGDPLERFGDFPPDLLVELDFLPNDIAAKGTFTLPDPRAGGAKAQILGHRVHFDAARDLWYCDVRIVVTDEPWPFLRLGLVRYQPESLPERELSDVVTTDLAQLPPNRTVTFNREGATGIRIQITGKQTANSSFSLRHERFMPDPFDATTGLASDAGVRTTNGWTLTSGPTGGATRANLLLSFPGNGPGQTVMNELEAGRVVVEETTEGLALLTPTAANRVVFTEAVARADIPEL